MKAYLFLLLVSISSCSSLKVSKFIQYVVPFQLEERLATEIITEKKFNIIFSLAQKNDSTYIITMVKFLKSEQQKIDKLQRISKTNRYILVKNKFYPLLFESDYVFGTLLNKRAISSGIKEKWMDESLGIRRLHPIYDNSISITFTTKGAILNYNTGFSRQL